MPSQLTQHHHHSCLSRALTAPFRTSTTSFPFCRRSEAGTFFWGYNTGTKATRLFIIMHGPRPAAFISLLRPCLVLVVLLLLQGHGDAHFYIVVQPVRARGVWAVRYGLIDQARRCNRSVPAIPTRHWTQLRSPTREVWVGNRSGTHEQACETSIPAQHSPTHTPLHTTTFTHPIHPTPHPHSIHSTPASNASSSNNHKAPSSRSNTKIPPTPPKNSTSSPAFAPGPAQPGAVAR